MKKLFALLVIFLLLSSGTWVRASFRSFTDCGNFGADIGDLYFNQDKDAGLRHIFWGNTTNLINLFQYVDAKLENLNRGSVLELIKSLKELVVRSFVLHEVSKCGRGNMRATQRQDMFVNSLVSFCNTISTFELEDQFDFLGESDVNILGYTLRIVVHNAYSSRRLWPMKILCKLFPCCNECDLRSARHGFGQDRVCINGLQQGCKCIFRYALPLVFSVASGTVGAFTAMEESPSVEGVVATAGLGFLSTAIAILAPCCFIDSDAEYYLQELTFLEDRIANNESSSSETTSTTVPSGWRDWVRFW